MQKILISRKNIIILFEKKKEEILMNYILNYIKILKLNLECFSMIKTLKIKKKKEIII